MQRNFFLPLGDPPPSSFLPQIDFIFLNEAFPPLWKIPELFFLFCVVNFNFNFYASKTVWRQLHDNWKNINITKIAKRNNAIPMNHQSQPHWSTSKLSFFGGNFFSLIVFSSSPISLKPSSAIWTLTSSRSKELLQEKNRSGSFSSWIP